MVPRERGAPCAELQVASRIALAPSTLSKEGCMRTLLATLTAADDKKLTPQQEKMKACNIQAADKKGDERGVMSVV